MGVFADCHICNEYIHTAVVIYKCLYMLDPFLTMKRHKKALTFATRKKILNYLLIKYSSQGYFSKFNRTLLCSL